MDAEFGRKLDSIIKRLDQIEDAITTQDTGLTRIAATQVDHTRLLENIMAEITEPRGESPIEALLQDLIASNHRVANAVGVLADRLDANTTSTSTVISGIKPAIRQAVADAIKSVASNPASTDDAEHDRS
jgi:hypothetical protein